MSWIVYGILAALFWGTYSIFSKVLTANLGLPVENSIILMFLGIGLVFLLYFFFKTNLSYWYKIIGLGIFICLGCFLIFYTMKMGISITLPIVLFGFGQGILWGAGMIFTFLAYNSGADTSRLVPIYNTNTLVAIFLGIAFLHELPLPDQRIKVFLGALLIIIGGLLVSK